jgi:hypothetical protein
MNASDAIAAVQLQLREHWRLHPHAADTCAGIARWWFNPPAAEAEVQAALQALQRAGLAVAVAAADGRVRWRCVA